MSMEYRVRLARVTPTQLQISEAEWKFVWSNIGDFCIASDLAIKARYGANANEEAEIKKMSDDQFLGFARQVVANTLLRLGYRKKNLGQEIVEQQLQDQYNTQGQAMMAEAQSNQQTVFN